MKRLRHRLRGAAVYVDTRDLWIGYYRGDTHHYVCPVPAVVVRINRRGSRAR